MSDSITPAVVETAYSLSAHGKLNIQRMSLLHGPIVQCSSRPAYARKMDTPTAFHLRAVERSG